MARTAGAGQRIVGSQLTLKKVVNMCNIDDSGVKSIYERNNDFLESLDIDDLKNKAKNGSEVAQLKSAIYYYQLSADQNNPLGFLHLASCFAKGNGVEKSFERATYYYKLSADLGNAFAKYSLADYLIENHVNEEKAIEYLTSVIKNEKDDISTIGACEYKLGYCYAHGIGVEKSPQDAINYYTLSAKHDYGLAQNRLGDCYFLGVLGLKKSYEKAVEYYKLASKNNCSYSLLQLGMCYEQGLGVEKSNEKAFNYYSLAADYDVTASKILVARCYEFGIGTETSLEKAAYYYKFAAENDSTAYYSVGKCYRKMGGKENLERAVTYFKMAIGSNLPLDQIKKETLICYTLLALQGSLTDRN